MKLPRILAPTLVLLAAGAAAPAHAEYFQHQFEKVQLSDQFYAEGAHFGDINGDGVMDVVAGPYWYEGPDFESAHEYYEPALIEDRRGYSEHFFTFTHDLNGNGRTDILVLGFPGREARWYENPGPDGHGEHWPVHVVFHGVDNESPTFTDITGDGNPEIVCSRNGAFGYVRADWDNPSGQWTFHPISPEGPAGGHFTHGLGVGDVNGNGRIDLLEKNGWWEQPESLDGDPEWTFHRFQFSGPGGAQMYAYDINGDGLNDVITSLRAHAYGFAWFEQVRDDEGNISFERHDIMTDAPDDSPYGVAFSQLHALELVDMNGNGLLDIVTGKRWWAHGGRDPGADEPAVVYWFELTRDEEGNAEFVPHEIDDDSGIGTQVVAGDVSGNGLPDIVVANKKGSFVHLHTRREVSVGEWHRLTGAQAPGLVPEEAARAMSVPDGFHVDLVAGEPDVRQPIAQAIDHRGRLWIAENYAYPRWQEEGNDRLLILEDTTGDRRFDKRTVFHDELNFISGIAVGHGGVFVGAPPNLLFIPIDETGDAPAGEPEVLLDGWGYQDTHETLNSFIWGPDGWLYGCQGVFTHSNVGRPGAPNGERERINAGVWRYHPVKKEFEVFAHGTSNPWGVDFDDHGEAFMTACVIPHAWHMVQGGRYHRQSGSHFNGHTYDDIQTIGDHAHYSGAIEEHAAWGQPPQITGAVLAAGGGHAHAGAMIYLGDNWPDEYRNTLLMNNIHGNRVNHDLLEPDGRSGFVASHGEDFLVANDQWYRGLNLQYGPDGGVFVIDWYDEQACHHLDYDIWNRAVGRVYKITYGDPEPVRVDLSELSDAELVELQLHANDWYVRQARTLLHERGPNPAVHASLRRMLAEQDDITRRLRALWALHVTEGLTETIALDLLDSDEPYLRGWTIQLITEDRQVPDPLHSKLARMSREEPSPIVRRYLASALQRLDHDHRWDIAEGLATRTDDAEDHNIPLLIWYGVEPLVAHDPERAMELASRAAIPQLQRYIIRRAAANTERLAPVITLLRETDDPADLRLILEEMVRAYEDEADLPMPDEWDSAYEHLMAMDDAMVRDRAVFLAVRFGDERVFPRMRDLLADRGAAAQERRRALEVLIAGRDREAVPVFHSILDDPAVRGPAIRALAAHDHPDTPAAILRHYRSFNAGQRDDAINTLAARPAYALELLGAIDRGDVERGDLSAFTVRQMAGLEDEAVDRKLTEVWGAVRSTSEDNARRIEQYKDKLTDDVLAEADLSHGRAVFNQSCAACHRLFDAGGDIGPDITGSNRADLDYILENIIDPNATVGLDYQLNIMQLDDGRVLSGMIRSESETSLAVQTLNERVVVSRDEVARTQALPTSMMPEGLIDELSDAEVRDLIAYLASPRQVALPAEAPEFGADGRVAGAIEGEGMEVIELTGGEARSQPMGSFTADRWSADDHLWWTGAQPGDRLTLARPVPEPGLYELKAVMTKARDYGVVQLYLDDEPIGGPVDLFNAPTDDRSDVITTGLISFGRHQLGDGDHTLTVEIVGANSDAAPGYMFGLDFVLLERAE